ncbi:bifunctional DNA primase/polymerase [Mycobacterium sp.]|uniref:bifunctional DNA primase/polymerase n=1 Tax=Mycobacterium sp. TaxID=1785 RepID=UPI003F99952F
MKEEDALGLATEGNYDNSFATTNVSLHDTGQQRQRVDEQIYSRAAWLYRDAGWRGVLPLPPVEKFPPPTGFTGYEGAWPTDEQIGSWIARRPADANLGLRVDYVIIGIDVDAYGEKTGGLTLQQAESLWGALPPTYRSTSRLDDPISGIRLFKVPAEVLFKTVIKFDELGIGHIEIIQQHHRLIVCWPSVHPKTGQVYRWFAPHGTLLPEAVVPRVEDIPDLPERWVDELSRDAVREEVFDGSAPNRTAAQQAKINEELYRQLIALSDDGSPDRVVAERLDRAMVDLTSGTGSRYDTTRDHVAALMRCQAVGRVGVTKALSQLFGAYVLEVADTRPQVVAEAEFLRFTDGAAALVAASSPAPVTATQDANGDNGSDSRSFTDGATFILDMPEEIPAMWGEDQRVAWPEDESLMICGPPGVGKTTLAGMVIRAQLGGMASINEQVLGLPVAQVPGKILYLAMDRPAQIARSLRRQFTEGRRHVLHDRLVIWKGPPPGDIATNPKLLAELAERTGASVVYLDSLKDAAVGLSEDSVGAGYNRARQHLLSKGIQLVELHHTVKKSGSSGSQVTVSDVYGSAWLTAGAGSVIMLIGQPGDPIVTLRHVKQPAAEIGPLVLSHDETTGTLSVLASTDPIAVVGAAGEEGLTAKALAVVMFDSINPTKAEIEKARRQLDKLANDGVIRCIQGTTGGPTGGTPTRWVAA